MLDKTELSSTKINGKLCDLQIVDTAGDHMLHLYRKSDYEHADLYIICVAADNRASLESVQFWSNEVRLYENGKPMVLVQTKKDRNQAVKFEEIMKQKKLHNLQAAYQTSAKENNKNVFRMFQSALRIAHFNKFGEELD